MAYNLQSLITILERILNPQETRWILDDNKPQLESLLKKAASLQKVVDNSSVPRIESVEKSIRDAAHQAEDIIELRMSDQMLSSPKGESFTFSTPDLQQVTQQLDSAMEQVAELMKRKNMSTSTGGSSSGGPSLSPDPTSLKRVVVGIDADLLQLKDRLTGTRSKLEIIPIVGMGGVGKTTLARKLYEDPNILSHFKSLAWTTISQEYNIKAILLGLLRCIIGKDQHDQYIENESDELRDILYKSLFGRKYMIVLDDVWSTDFWDVMRSYFPDNNNGSRIVITTRELNVAKYADSKSLHHEVQLLSESESWNLLRQVVFGEEDCSDGFEVIGTKIAGDCGGLPLAINVIAGLLSKVERSKDVWESIGDDVKAAIAESDKQFSQILNLSYSHLPNHLKPCFLYMGAFPEDYEIKTSKLACMWVAEGFVKSNEDESLEEEAEDYLKALVERNLLLVRHYEYNGKPKRCSMHDLLRDVCMRKADEEKFLHIKNDSEMTFSNMRRVSVSTEDVLDLDGKYDLGQFFSLSRSFIYTGCRTQSYNAEIQSLAFFALRLLRVLDVIKIPFHEFPEEILQLVGLRYLALECDAIPTGISKLCNLQALTADLDSGDMPSELWEMSELRHFNSYKGIWIGDDYMKRFVMKKLEKISCVAINRSVIGRGFFDSIPNIKNFGIYCSDDILSNIEIDLSHFHKLETLRCFSRFKKLDCCYLPTAIIRYPCSLRKLTLDDCLISSRVMTTLCAIPKLEMLKIYRCVFESEEETDEEWEAAEGDIFLSLQFLKLESLDVVRWRADETNFPKLRHLFIRDCSSLEEIPCGFGDITTLQLLELRECSESLVASAKQIQEVQQSEYDDYSLQVRIYDTRSP